DQSLATRLAQSPVFKERFQSITPGVTLRGSAARADARGRTAGVQITALADRYAVPAGQVVLNGELAQDLGGVGVGVGVRFSLPAPDEAPRESTLARRSRDDTILSFAVETSKAAQAGGFLDLFNLSGGQRPTPDAWVNLQSLQEEMDRAAQANLFLVAARPGRATPADAEVLNALIPQVATLADYGLEKQKSADNTETVVSSRSTYILPPVAQAAERVAAEQKVPLRKVSVYLVNRVARAAPAPVIEKREARSGKREGGAASKPTATTKPAAPVAKVPTPASKPSAMAAAAPKTRASPVPQPQGPAIHYAIAAGISDLDGKPLAPNEAAVNQWTADQMGLKPGDLLTFDYYVRKPNGDLVETRSRTTFKVARILPMTGIGADPTLTPTYKGLTDADTIADWRPPAGLNINKKLVTKADEAYWSQHKAAPKVFISLETAARLWGTAFGDVTSLRVPADKGEAFATALAKQIPPAAMGMIFRPIKSQQLAAASGGTEFGGLFIGFSFFLLIAAILLVAMLFRLSIEQRARQLGLLSACGFAPRQLRNLCLREGLLLAIVGGILGGALAVAYTALIIHGLRTWWVGAIGTTALRLHVVPATLAGGLVASVIVAMLAILWAVRRVAKAPPASLLAGALQSAAVRLARPPKKSLVIALLAALAAIVLFAAGATRKIDTTGAFLGGGSMLLLAALLLVFARLRPAHHAVTTLSLGTLAIRNATRHRTRSLLCVALIALASFTLVTVSSMESGTPRDTFDKHSGAGGYALIVQTDIPLLGDLNSPAGRQLLMRLKSAKDPRWNKAHFAMMRAWAGQDISCLNVTRPDSPTILTVPRAMMASRPDGSNERFRFAGKAKDLANPWDLLNEPQSDENTVPVIADDESAKYILHLNIGDAMPITDATGRPRKLKLVATLAGSIFQSEMLMGEPNFLRLFPAQAGFSTVLVDTTPTDESAVAGLLRETLNDTTDQEKSDYSASIETTAARLQAYHQVANTYLSTFRVLGSLGLMLGTIGLAVVLVRNLIERRPELALLSALGFDPQRRTRLVLWENVSLLLLGMLIGAGCALAGVIPNVLTSAYRINVRALSIALAAVLVVGLASLVIAVRLAGRRVTPAALRTE
ncbi:MAG TPA: FtsX-like permease family protein, partial [Tepidisphaeraceae bacterium]